jgi:phage/plasmid-associated DNA primase
MKQLTGGDFVQARAPYMPEIITFKPQFKLVVCSNQFMEIKSQDNGTWRRIRVVDFMSLFTANPVDNDKEKPYQFTADENIKDKFEEWKELFLAMLVQRAFETGGIVSDCPIVMQSSESYKASQDCVSQFINDYIVIDNKARTTKGDLNGEFSMWYEVNKGKREKPNVGELHAAIDKKFGKYSKTKKAWMGIRMIYENDTTNANDTDDEDGADNLIE